MGPFPDSSRLFALILLYLIIKALELIVNLKFQFATAS